MTTGTLVPLVLGGSERLLAGTDGVTALPLAAHRRVHGWLTRPTERNLLADLEAARLVGRGGAAFPVARKLSAVSAAAGARGGDHPVVVANGSESEPASHKDRALMRLAPHLVLDGVLVVAHALRAQRVVLAVHDEASAESLTTALAERTEETAITPIGLSRTDGDFVGGEARALVAGLNGRPALPPGRPALPSTSGVDGAPTFLANVETFAQIGLLACRGVRAYLATGTPGEPGTSLLTVLGDVPRRGVAEVPHGTPLDVLAGRRDAPVLIGGYHGTWLRWAARATVERGALRSAGAMFGAGVLARLPETTCPLGEVRRVAAWLAARSTRQCGPCTFGLPAVVQSLDTVLDGGGPTAVAALRARARSISGRGACGHPDGATRFVLSAVGAFPEDVELHGTLTGCGRTAEGWLPLP